MNSIRWTCWFVLASCASVCAQPPMLQVTGTVTDAETGAPIESLWVIPGAGSPEHVGFTYSEATEHENGNYVHLHYKGSGGDIVRIEADGYLPVVSPVLDTQNDTTFDAKLRRGSNIHGRVATPDGTPAAGAEVMMISDCMSMHLENQQPADKLRCPLVVADEQGRFSFRPYEGRFDIIALHDTGRARVPSTDLAAEKPITLTPWARVEGVVMIGSKPGASQEVRMSRAHWIDDWDSKEYGEYHTTTDEGGRFAFDRVQPIDLMVGRLVRVEAPSKLPVAGLNSVQIITGEPGKTTTVRLGGAGRPVVGRLRFPADMPEEFLIDEAQLGPTPERERAAAEGPREPVTQRGTRTRWDALFPYRHILPIERDGSFRVDGVLPGEYVLSINLWEYADDSPMGRKRNIGWVRMALTVAPIPGGRTDEPLDLGEIDFKTPG